MDTIQKHIQTLAENIGPRPPLSEAVVKAQQYIADQLRAVGYDITQQHFYSPENRLYRWGPAVVITLAGLLLTGQPRRSISSLGMGLLSLASWGSRQARVGNESLWEAIIPQAPATNLITTIPPEGEMKNRVVFVAHVDTAANNDPLRQWLPDVSNIIERLPLLSMSIPMTPKINPLRRILMFGSALQLFRLGMEAQAEPTSGANDNASSVALLLELARALRENPLKHTEVNLVFTESDTIGNRGLSSLVEDYLETWKSAHWIVLDSIGSGELCWLHNDASQPEREIEAHFNAIAHENRQWSLMGRALDIPDPSVALQQQHLNATALVGYQRENDKPAYFRSSEDSLDRIDANTLQKAWDVVQAMLKRLENDTDD